MDIEKNIENIWQKLEKMREDMYHQNSELKNLFQNKLPGWAVSKMNMYCFLLGIFVTVSIGAIGLLWKS
jgi:hypothetical protein